MGSALIFSDLHAPFHDKQAVSNLYEVAKEIRPSIIVLAGDGPDFFSFSRFPKTAITTPNEELQEAIAVRLELWKKLKMISPDAKCIELGGNHVARVEKLITSRCPEIAGLVDIKRIMEIPGVDIYPDEKEEISINGSVVCHGWMSRPGAHAEFFQKSVIHGHDHKAYIIYSALSNSVKYEMSVGCLCDFNATPLKYRATKSCKWVHACGVVDHRGPRIVLL